MTAATQSTHQTTVKQHWLSRLYGISRSGLNWLSRTPELKVWHCMMCLNPSHWQAYDPQTNEFFSATSEAEMRFWIEQHDRS